ncbi:MAG TPA: asparagine synthase C-terminal domain-containing protein, partial [Polyangia bacterium]|nr:asparagine synthase C-terminal domain-containing protein [Polyangia bacterium]
RAGTALPAFTIAFAQQAAFDYDRTHMVTSDDEPYAAMAAAELGLTREVVAVDRRQLPADLAALARQNDALPAWEQELAQHHLARAAARRCKAVLVGDAADETHYGYHFLLDDEATRSPDAVVARFAVPIIRADVLADPVAHVARRYRERIAAAGHDWDDPEARVRATTWLIVHRWLPRLLHNGDIHTMAHSLEARVPFAERALLAVAQRVAPRVALAGGVEKSLLREAARGIIPDDIRTRRKSALPKDQGVAAVYQAELARLLDESGELLRGVVDRERARALCATDRTLYESERALAFRLICLVHWARAYAVRMP